MHDAHAPRGSRARTCAFLIGALAAAGGACVSPARAEGNFVQLRALWSPGDAAAFSSHVTLDAALASTGGPVQWSVRLKDTSLERQDASVSVSSAAALAQVTFTGDAGASSGSRRNRLDVSGAYVFGAAARGVSLAEIDVAYSMESDSGATDGYLVNAADVAVKGALAPGWRWTLGYGLASTTGPAAPAGGPSHAVSAALRGRLNPVDVKFSADARFDDAGPRYEVKLEGVAPVSGAERAGVNVKLDTVKGDEERVNVASSRLAPFDLSVEVGRGTTAPFLWKVDAEAPAGGDWTLGVTYEGAAGASAEHAFTASAAYDSGAARATASGEVGASLDADAGLWFGSLAFHTTASYAVAPWTVNARADVEYRPDAWTAKLTGGVGWAGGAWRTTLDVAFAWGDQAAGTASAQVLYALAPGVSLNTSGVYRVGAAGREFSAGMGLRVAL